GACWSVIVNGRLTGPAAPGLPRRQPTLPQLIDENKALHRKLFSQERLIATLIEQTEALSGNVPEAPGQEEEASPSASPAQSTSELELKGEPSSDGAFTEYLGKLGLVFGMTDEDSRENIQPTFPLLGAIGQHSLASVQSLIPVQHSALLVRWHCDYLHWIHPVFHVPGLLQEHDQWISALSRGEASERPYEFYAFYHLPAPNGGACTRYSSSSNCFYIADWPLVDRTAPVSFGISCLVDISATNVNDHELSDDRPIVPHQLSHITCVSHLLVVGRLADIFRDLSSAIRSKESLASRLECVKGFESRLDHLFDDFPELRPNDNEVYSSYIDPSKTFDWKPWSRFVWATAVSTCRIQLYRWLLCRSYAEGRFLEIREPDAASRQRLRSEVQAFITLLRSSDSNAMIRRGIVLLDKMLAVADSAAKRGSNGGEVGSGLAVDIAVGGGGEIESEMSMASWAASVPLTLDSDFLNILLNNDPWVSTSWMTE
ncbi:hypothetical protein EHS25_009884, partial [Saitozyma podzolica]